MLVFIAMTENNEAKQNNSAGRPPIVVVLGHVDHGKTSILDKIRQTKVAEKEAGGITQHIGAYQAEHNGKKITFLDTPGHEAFSAIRSRGAKVADIAVLVVAADEGVKPQTKEAIQIIKASGIPFVVAINKTDKEGSNPSRVRQELAEQEVLVEDYGGTTPVIELSAKKNEGINELLEMILLLAELEELTSPLGGPAKGIIIESHIDSRRGIVATLIVQEGELKVGDWVAAGTAIGKAKSLEDFLNKSIRIAIASQPCVLLGWESAPRLGQEFKVVASREEAEKEFAGAEDLGPVNLFIRETGPEEQTTNKKTANIIVKADVQSSLEAIDQSLKTIHSDEVDYRIAGFGIGNINDADIKTAMATNAFIVGFHVGMDSSVRQLAERENIKAEAFDIIYELIEAVRSNMSDLLDPEIRRIPLGKMKILGIFKGTGKSQVIGGKVTQGKAVRGAMIDVIRNGAILTNGKLGQLQQSKADVTEVSEGLECGIRLDPLPATTAPIAVKEGDVLEIYQEEKIKRSI
jgi:translation initiation factor IF-2